MNRTGVSLTEVLVAAVLLAVGIGGTLGALSTAVRFRSGATAREAMAAVAQDRLSWFEAAGCIASDSVIDQPVGGFAARESWQVARDSAGVRLAGSVRGRAAGVMLGVALDTHRRCD